MSELSNRAWATKILRGLEENSRRFAAVEEKTATAAPKMTRQARGKTGAKKTAGNRRR